MFVVKDAVREPLYAIVPYFNPWRWKSREKLALRALKHFHDSGCVIVLVEAAFNRREFTLADSGLDGKAAECGVLGQDHRFKHKYIGLRTKDELWLKECLINTGAMQLPHDWRQVCWPDADVHFLRDNWVGECIHQLQHFKFIQMFSHARDVGPNSEMLPENYPHANGMSFMQAWHGGHLDAKIAADLGKIRKDLAVLSRDVAQLEADLTGTGYPGGIGPIWPGLSWACTREAWDGVGGLLDIGIGGGADYDMAYGLVENMAMRMPGGQQPNYSKVLLEWEGRCKRHIRRNVGVMQGSIIHRWHGKKKERQYVEKGQLVYRVQFDPTRFLKRDSQGLWQLHDDGSEQFIKFRDEMRRLAKARNEDSIDV